MTLPAQAGTWDHGHGDAANSGFVDLATRPALRPNVLVSGIGTYATGVGPVLGPGGTIYLGSLQGDLRAFNPNGSLAWNYALGSGNRIVAPPVVDTDGSIYVVGERTFSDNRYRPPIRRTDTTLYRIAAGGTLRWAVPFPLRYGNTVAANRGATSASPNIWRYGSSPPAVMVPVVYDVLGGAKEFRLLAFELNYGALVRDQLVTFKNVGALTNNSVVWDVAGCAITFCWLPKLIPGFTVSATPLPVVDQLPANVAPPMSSLAIFSLPGGGLPFVVVNDPWKATVGYTYRRTSGFAEAFRKIDSKRYYATTPIGLGDGHSLAGTADGTTGRLVFSGPNLVGRPDLPATDKLFATPARTRDGRIVAVAGDGALNVSSGTNQLQRIPLSSESVAPPAVSRTHIFVSTAGSLRTFDATTLAEVGLVPWGGGGQSSPAIGASGQVYALANNILYGWPGPATCQLIFCGPRPPVVAGTSAR